MMDVEVGLERDSSSVRLECLVLALLRRKHLVRFSGEELMFVERSDRERMTEPI
jgi:hypothetical protein